MHPVLLKSATAFFQHFSQLVDPGLLVHEVESHGEHTKDSALAANLPTPHDSLQKTPAGYVGKER